MDPLILSAVLIILLLLLLASGIWVALSLLAVGLIAMVFFTSAPSGLVMATTVWGASASWTLTALPLFIWMGEILFRTRLSEDMFQGLAPWMARLPGRLMHVNIVGCGIFAAVSGSSAATCATIGRMSLPELKRRGYDERMSIGTLAGSGTLGLLIPPSIIMIVYGVAADVSIGRLFIAGVLPGILLIALFMGYVAVWSLMNPDRTPPGGPATTLGERLQASRRLIPVVVLIAAVIGSIYSGIATATEAAALGVAGALVLSAASGTLTWSSFRESLMGAMVTSSMIAFILAGAAFLTVAMGFTGIPRVLAQFINDLGLSPLALLAALTAFFVLLGCFLDGISMVVLTTSVVMPMVQAAGIDPLWFGIYIVLVVEMAQITPPVGFNLFVLQGLTGRDILYVARAAFPFFLILVTAIVLVTVFPGIVTWLPAQMIGR
ncbi:TRAP transporter large permease subunit [Skermanella mucosa]|uniref:TRAP transporter large permease n=1 Tax=Skermanella mucosa TaxID=1789672 RepID=UPI00192CB9A9|nr:TRAP transporter large permease subunit [Skermanella mucosa]UEM20305.1 TRAP transporter large permease subunit [Skermanella mucosa]